MTKQKFEIDIPHIFTELSEEESAVKLFETVAELNGYSETIQKTVEVTGTEEEYTTAMVESPDVVLISSDNDTYVWETQEEVPATKTKCQFGKNVLAKDLLPKFKQAIVHAKTAQLEQQLEQAKSVKEQTVKAVIDAVDAAIDGIEPK